jgi:hypothetical protein
VGFETTALAGDLPETYALDCAATLTDNTVLSCIKILSVSVIHNYPTRFRIIGFGNPLVILDQS